MYVSIVYLLDTLLKPVNQNSFVTSVVKNIIHHSTFNMKSIIHNHFLKQQQNQPLLNRRSREHNQAISQSKKLTNQQSDSQPSQAPQIPNTTQLHMTQNSILKHLLPTAVVNVTDIHGELH